MRYQNGCQPVGRIYTPDIDDEVGGNGFGYIQEMVWLLCILCGAVSFNIFSTASQVLTGSAFHFL